MTTNRTKSLEQILSSTGRIRILSLLSKVQELHLTEISRRTDQSYTATERHLQALEDAELVEEKDYGRVRMFRLNLENPRARMIRDLTLHWDQPESQIRTQAQA